MLLELLLIPSEQRKQRHLAEVALAPSTPSISKSRWVMKVETVGCVLSQATATALQPPGLLPLLPAAATAGYLLLLLDGLTGPTTATTYPAAATYCSWRTCAAAVATTGCGGGPAAGATSG